MSKSAIYTANTTSQSVLDNGLINPGSVIRRYGCNCHLSNNAIGVSGTGYYDITASFTIVPTTDGEATVSIYKDGVPIPGATATETATAAGDSINLSVISIVREYCPCCDDTSNLSFIFSGVASTITNVAIKVKKI